MLAGDRTLPVVAPLAPLLPHGALVRGRTMACQGEAATSLALTLAVEAVAAGAWLAVVDMPWVGVEAAGELGITLERLVRVDCGGRPGAGAGRGGSWAEIVAALLDGFEIVITRLPTRLGAGMVRKVQTRVKAREAVLILVDETAGAAADITLRTSNPAWDGIADGHGHLRVRRVEVEASGRRIAGSRRAVLWLPGPTGAVATAVATDEPVSTDPEAAPTDPTPEAAVLRPAG